MAIWWLWILWTTMKNVKSSSHLGMRIIMIIIIIIISSEHNTVEILTVTNAKQWTLLSRIYNNIMRQHCTNLETAWYCFVILEMIPCSSHGTWTLDTLPSISPVVPTSFSLAPRRETPSAFKSSTRRSGATAETSFWACFHRKMVHQIKFKQVP